MYRAPDGRHERQPCARSFDCPPLDDPDFQAQASHLSTSDPNLHRLKICPRSHFFPPSSISTTPSELYPFVFFSLPAIRMNVPAFLILVLDL